MSRLARVDVPALLARLGLKAEKRGKEWWACCPFHEERTPSFCVRDQQGDEERHAHWRCYGSCEVRGGSAVGLVMRMLGIDREGAWLWIGGEGEAPPPPLAAEVEVRRPGEPFRLPSGVILAPLDRWVTPARKYAERRGLTAEQVDRWRLGFAVDGWLGGRVVLPVRDHGGRLLSYTGRTFLPGAGKKWREPRVEEGADKAAVFGEERWPSLGERGRVVLAEAALDALAVERAVPGASVAAVYGSELLPGAVARLVTFREVVVASDPDAAGDKLYEQVRAALGRWSSVRRAALPEGYDANALEREPDGGPEALARVILEAT